MTSRRLERVQALFEAALEQPEAQRLDALRSACGDDEDLLQEVRELLAADAEEEAFVDRPVTLLGEPERDDPLPAGTTVGDYVLERELGHGGFGRVYRAVHPVIGKTAAVKVLYSQYSASPEHARRFVNEARAVNEIHHPDIIDVFAFGETPDGCLYFVMELIEGPTLEELLRERGPMPLATARPLLRRLAAAVDAAHACGVVHRDLKPSNVLVQTEADGSLRPKLLDFGIAKLRLATGEPLGPLDSRESLDDNDAVMGTPQYMSPEQARGEAVDARADVYAFGVLVYRTLTGRLPFEQRDAFELMMAHAGEEPPPPSSHAPSLSARVDAVVLSMLAKAPADRPPTLTEAVAGLDEPAPAPATTTATATATATAKDRRGWLWLGAAAVALGGAAWWAGSDHEPARGPDEPSPPAPGSDLATIEAIAEPSPAPPTDLPRPAEVALELVDAPESTEVLDPRGQPLGTAPGTITLPRSDEPLTLTFRCEGHEDLRLAVVPDQDRRVPVVLEPKRKGSRRRLNPDLESPFR